MNTITTTVTRILEKLLIILMTAMVFDVTWQIITRFILSKPSSFTEELAGFILMWISLLGGSYAYHKKAHLGIDILTSRLSGRIRFVAHLFITLAVFFFALFVMVLGGIRLVNITFTLRQISPALKISMGYIYLVLPFAGVLMMFYSLDYMFHPFSDKSPATSSNKV